MTLITSPCAVRADELHDLVREDEVLLADEDLVTAAGLANEARARTKSGRVAAARDLLTLGARRLLAEGGQSLAEVEPLYLRAFGA